ncbi:MAG: hypothetical protein JRJ86_22685, partial [Deltaproteobacteria bacterium]|nr:hypothetical protein [Deltaproteobacteria bacterium]
VPLERLEEEVNDWAQAICAIPLDALISGKAQISLELESRGMEAGYVAAWVGHAISTNMRIEPDEWNFLKERRDKGFKQALRERDDMVAPYFRMRRQGREQKETKG